MSDGRVLEEDGPSFLLTYNSGLGDYQRRIAIFGPGEREGTFDAWCYVYDSLRTYRCDRVVRLEELETSKTVTGDELMELLWPERRIDR